ncbi:HNH endonuclease [Vibrio owensii]|uniref:HNH endonuclease n=1 Tax=Vibrio owensii TaxID=696485 RepID=UPI003394DE86
MVRISRDEYKRHPDKKKVKKKRDEPEKAISEKRYAARSEFAYFYNTSQWRALAKRILSKNPVCMMCEALDEVTPANHVDHWLEIKQFDELKMDVRHLVPMCQPCHNQKTAEWRALINSKVNNSNKIKLYVIKACPLPISEHPDLMALIEERLIAPAKARGR